MIALGSTSSVLKGLFSSAPGTAQYIKISYADHTYGRCIASSVVSQVTSSNTTLLSAPAADTERIISSIIWTNTDSGSLTLTLTVYDGTNTATIKKVLVGVNYTLTFANDGWEVSDSTGALMGIGAQGATGLTGPQGVAGSVGAQGAKGDTGSSGAQGAAGATGAQGSTGAQGAPGSTDHGALTGLSDDDHSQYIHNAPATTARNKITGAKGAAALQLKTDTNGAIVLDIVDTADVSKFNVDENGNVIIKGTITMDTQTIAGLAAPSAGGDAVNKTYADALKAPSFVTLATSSDLTNERVLTAGSNISLTDAGAGSTITVKATPAGSDTQLQYNNSSSFGGISKVTTDGTHLQINDTTTAPTAIANKVIPWAFDFQDSQIPLLLQPGYGIAFPVMPMSPWRRVSWVGMGGSALTSIGAGGSTTGTYSAPSPATTNFRTKMVKGDWATASSANSSAGLRNTTHQCWLGSAAGEGGFLIVGVVANATTVAQQAGFFGLIATASDIGDVNPSNNVNSIGFMYDAAETTWRIGHNDASGTCTRVDLGANYGINTTDAFLMVLSAKPNATVVDYFIRNLATGNETSGQLSTNLPANTTMMWCQLHVGNRTTASAASIQTPGFTVVTDY
jgi:hypothetical protein